MFVASTARERARIFLRITITRASGGQREGEESFCLIRPSDKGVGGKHVVTRRQDQAVYASQKEKS